jgi:dihydrofolate synthase/folylpolyglutamate synthase
VVLTRVEGERAAEPEHLLTCMPEGERHKAILAPRPTDALAKAVDLAGKAGLVVIAGSLYLLGELRPILLGEIA